MKNIHSIKVEWKFTPANPCCYKPYETKYPRIWFQDTRWQRCFIGKPSLTELAVFWISEKLIFDMGIGFGKWNYSYPATI